MTGVLTLRAVHDFDPNEMRYIEKMELENILLSLMKKKEKPLLIKQLLDYMKAMMEITPEVELTTLKDKVQHIGEETSGIQNHEEAIKMEELEGDTRGKQLSKEQEDRRRTNESGENVDSEEVDPYILALAFEKRDKMKTIPPSNIGDKVRWWMVEHLNSGKIGFIPRNRVVIDANHQLSKTTLNELPLEMLDIILQNSYLCWTMHSSPNQRDEDIIKALASVNCCWFQRIARRRFKKTVWRRLKEFYEKTKKNSALIRDNREFLLANIQPNGELFDSLLSRNCITEKQSRFIQRNGSERARNTDLLHVVGSFDMTMMPYFINCLRQTDQKTVARIIENGGGMIKVDVEDRSPMNATSMDTKLIHEAIEKLRQRTTPRSHQTEKLMSQLKEEGLEILNSQLDKQAVVVWIWCHSQTAIENIQKLYASNQLTEILFGFANIRPPTSEIFQSKLITIDSSELKKTLGKFL